MCSKFTSKIALVLAFLFPFWATAQITPLFDATTSVLLAPANLWTANQAGLSSALSVSYQPLDADLTAFAGIAGVDGDLLIYNGGWKRLGAGSLGQVLGVAGGLPAWGPAATGDVVGPASSTDRSIAFFNGTTGKLIGESSIISPFGTNLVVPGFVSGLDGVTSSNFVTLRQLAGSVNGGIVTYLNSAPASGFSVTGTTLSTNWMSQVMPPQTTNAAATQSNGNFVGTFVSTNKFTHFPETFATAVIYCFESAAGSGAIRPEVVIVNSVTKLEEFTMANPPDYQTVPAGTAPLPLTFGIPIQDYQSTTNFHVVLKLRLQESGQDPTIRIVTGGTYPSRATLPVGGDQFVQRTGDDLSGPLSAPIIYAGTNFVNELVATNGITLGGVRNTTWPSGGGTAATPLPLPGNWYQAGTSLYFLWSSTNSMPVLVNDSDTEWSIRCNGFVDQTIAAMPSQITVISRWRPMVGNTASQTLVAGVAVQQWRDADAFGTEVLSTNTVNGQTWITMTNILTSLDSLAIGQGFTLKVARKATSASDTSTNLAHFGGAIIKWQ